jgi:hypothetical protein
MTAKIKKLTKTNYKNMPKKYVPDRPLLTFEKLKKSSRLVLKGCMTRTCEHLQLTSTLLVLIYQTILLLV